MKVLTAAEMRDVDRRTIEHGIPGPILMENAGSRVVDYLRETFAPLARQRVAVFCGKGNNGGDGFVVARQLFTRGMCAHLTVVETVPAEELTGDAAQARRMLSASGCPVLREIPEAAQHATLVIDALLGTGVTGPAGGVVLKFIQAINSRFPYAQKVAIDIPSGFPSDETACAGEFVHADHTLAFTAMKRSQALAPSYEAMGRLTVCPIGTPAALCEEAERFTLRLTTPADVAPLFARRLRDSNKGRYGHALTIGGSLGKSGAAAMMGLAALRAGAGLVTVATAAGAISSVAAVAPELMTAPLPQTESGGIAASAQGKIETLLANKTVAALGPGMGGDVETVALVRQLFTSVQLPMVVDADGLNAIAGTNMQSAHCRILTPHPGEMGRLANTTAAAVQAARLASVETLAREAGASIVLKGDRTLIAFPEGETWINPTGSPALSTAGTGDVLTGLITGLIAQFPDDWKRAVVGAVWLHGRAGELAGAELGEQSVIATDLFRYLGAAIEDCRAAAV